MGTAASLPRPLRRRRALPPPSLRALATLAVPTVAILIVIIASWLVASTRTLDTAVQDLVADGRRARYLERVESSLLRYQRLSNAAVTGGPDTGRQAELEAIHRHLARANSASNTGADRRDVALLREHIDEYAATRAELEARGVSLSDIVDGTRASLNAALNHLDTIQRRYVEDLRASERRAAIVSQRATIQGAAVIVLVMLTAALTVLLFRTQVVVPLDRVRAAILEFRTSGKRTRAEQTGPVEIREIARALDETTAALAEDRKRQLAFVAGVAHDLKSPLTALTLAVSLLDELPPGAAGEELRARALRQIAGNAARLRRMVEDLMDVTRSEAGELPLDLVDLDLRRPAREVVDMHFVGTDAHAIVLTVPDEPVLVRGDPARIEQALVNLVSNAIKYSPGGGAIHITVAHTDAEAILSVRDEGVGIPEDEIPVLFEPFHRGTVSKHVAPGAGLGLSILARIVRAHGGRVEVESKLGEGSTFRVILPLAPS